VGLTELQIRKARAKEKRYMLCDERGLYLEILPSGRKFWRYRSRKDGKETRLSLGEYAIVSLKEAREKCVVLAKGKAQGLNPKKILKPAKTVTFEKTARDWFDKQVDGVRSIGHAETIKFRLERYLLPALGPRALKDIQAPELLAVLRMIESQGHIETAHRTMQIAGRIFRFGISIGECAHDISADLRGALIPNRHKHFASVTAPKNVADLVRRIGAYTGSFVVQSALWFSLYTFARPGEIRSAEWSEIDLDVFEWRIPAERMKRRRPHVVPLSRQVVEILKRIKPLTGHGRYIFSSIRTPNGARPMSENTVRVALRAMGYSNNDMTPHGFRSLASTNLNGQGWDGDLVELQLAHAEEDSVRAAYNFAERLPERKTMMQAWADWIDSLNQ
jgi:integrase